MRIRQHRLEQLRTKSSARPESGVEKRRREMVDALSKQGNAVANVTRRRGISICTLSSISMAGVLDLDWRIEAWLTKRLSLGCWRQRLGTQENMESDSTNWTGPGLR